MNIPAQLDQDDTGYMYIDEVMEIFKELLVIREGYYKVPFQLRTLKNEEKKEISEYYFKKVIEFLTKTDRGNETINKLRYLVSNINGCHLSIEEILKEL